MSKDVQWTTDQEKAINHRIGGAIVTAGAGSGKTAVLTTRIADMLCDKENYVDPSKLAVITFTKKAAAELKTRLNRMMRERLAGHPENAEFIRRQITLLHNARISTISAFCFSLVREYINLSTLASGFEIMEESRAAMTRYAVAEVAVEDFYKIAPEKELRLILDHFVGKNDKDLIVAVLSIYEYASNLPDPDSWYALCKDPDRLKDFLQEITTTCDRAEAILRSEFKTLADNLEQLKALPEKKQSTKANLKARACMDIITELCKELISYFNGDRDIPFSDVPIPDNTVISEKIPSCAKSNVGEAYSANLTLIVSTLTELNGARTAHRRLYKSQPVINSLLSVVKHFEELYQAEKQAMNVADYSDAERQLYNMLKNQPALKEDIGLQLIVVDEFQDSNRLQYEIFRMLSEDKKNLYFVGDIKQSIYAFRGAQSEVFQEVTKDSDFTCLGLNHNFRSRDNVVNSINDIFCPVMTETLGGVNYKDTSRLIAGDPQNISDSEADITEVIVVCDTESDAEYNYVAHRIDEMIRSGYKIEGRPCRAEDFAIILRSDTNKASLYAEALSAYDIQSTTKKGGGFFSEPEIQIMTDYLKVIDDPYNDESLARLLMSRLVGFSADKMAAIRTCTVGFDVAGIMAVCEEELKAYAKYWQRKPLYTCVKAAASGYKTDGEHYPALSRLYEERPDLFGSMKDTECAEFEAELDRLRGVMAASSPAELIKCIYDTTSVADLLTIGENGEARRANLGGLLSLASEYSSYHNDDILSDLLSHIDDMDKKGQKVEFSSGKSTSGVQIMSIHASKGLEFPIVFVCDCAKSFNKDDASKDVIMSPDYGISICDVDKALMAKIPSPSYKKTGEIIIEKLRSEEMRLLYVAATRAKYKLIFTGRPSGNGRKKETEVKLPDKESSAALATKDNYLSWLLIPYVKRLEQIPDSEIISDTDEIVGNIRYQAVSFYDCLIDDTQEDISADEGYDSLSDNEPEINAETIASRIISDYLYKASTEIAAKYTATGLAAMKRRDSDERCELYVSRPAFLRDADNKKLTGKRKGDAYHKLMEHIPFDKVFSEQEAKEYIDTSTADFLSDAERECIKPSDIALFFANDVAHRMMKCGRIYREFPIFHRLSENILSEINEDYKNIPDGCYVQGIADMFFIENDGIVLIDYKTDSFSDEEKLTEDYSFQLKVYAEALEKAFSLPVKEMFIYSFKKGKMVKI